MLAECYKCSHVNNFKSQYATYIVTVTNITKMACINLTVCQVEAYKLLSIIQNKCFTYPHLKVFIYDATRYEPYNLFAVEQ